ncbi:uncharacterized protein LOC112498850 [Citrus sinensis]|uniref:uncharacterized protein LOC112498850 n=1 Tax=Citrus sinensis TaxID=2711 RepID=UPI000D62E862|nr:uncharacterized protein LOC112498850 [Citrus sinensis]
MHPRQPASIWWLQPWQPVLLGGCSFSVFLFFFLFFLFSFFLFRPASSFAFFRRRFSVVAAMAAGDGSRCFISPRLPIPIHQVGKSQMGNKHTGPVRKRRAVRVSRVDNPPAGPPSHISISEGDRSPPSTSRSCNSRSELSPPRSTPRVSPRFPSKRPTPHPEKKGKSSKPKVSARSLDRPPKSPPATPSKSGNFFSLGTRRATLGDLERIRAKYNIPPSVQLRVPHVDERPECSKSDGIALHIDLFDLGLRLPLQPFYM